MNGGAIIGPAAAACRGPSSITYCIGFAARTCAGRLSLNVVVAGLLALAPPGRSAGPRGGWTGRPGVGRPALPDQAAVPTEERATPAPDERSGGPGGGGAVSASRAPLLLAGRPGHAAPLASPVRASATAAPSTGSATRTACASPSTSQVRRDWRRWRGSPRPVRSAAQGFASGARSVMGLLGSGLALRGAWGLCSAGSRAAVSARRVRGLAGAGQAAGERE